MAQRIFITGCARSGTTLLRRLFHAFSGVQVVPYEIDLDAFAAMEPDDPDEVLVGKRTIGTLLSNCLPLEEGRRQLEVLQARPDIRVLNIYRDGRDVVESEYAPPHRWYESMRQMCLAQDAGLVPGLLTLRYEDLVTDPDAIQGHLAQEYGLAPTHKWSEYPAFFAGDDHKDIYPPQAIGTHRVAKDLKAYRRLDPWLAPRMDAMLRHLGYLEAA